MEDVAESLPSEDNQPEDENENEEYALWYMINIIQF